MGSIEGYRAVENNLTLTVVTKEVVAAAVLPLQENWLPLSNLDLLLPPLDFGVFFCYKKPAATTGTGVVGALKKGLAEALVSFYALAGEVVTNSAAEPELLCNNRGVDFVEAEADVELRSLDLYNPDDSIEGKLVPQKKHGVLAIQATFLKCGGLVVACSFDHRIADAYSANMFLVSWAQSVQPTSSTLPWRPCFLRSLLSPRRPGRFHPSIDGMFVPVSDLPPPKQLSAESDPVISRIYYITADQLNHIQSLANSPGSKVVVDDGVKRTKLESFCAFLWRTVAASTKGKRVTTKMGIVVDGRRRLSNGGDRQKASLMGSYFGNVLSVPYGDKSARELTENSLSWVANEVHEFLEDAVTEEHFLGLIDWVEAHRPGCAVATIYAGGGREKRKEDEGPSFVVSSGQRFPEEKVDFGWGRPVFGSYHFPWGGNAGYVMPMPSPAGKGDWVVYMNLQKGQLEKIESEAGHVFRPLTWDYLLR